MSPNSNNVITEDLARKFCELCDWAYVSCITHKTLFDNNKDPETNIGKAKEFTSRLSTITSEYSLMQICKLHEPAIQGGSFNLTIDYMLRFGNWGEEETRIKEFVKELSELYKLINPARNKILAHNDLETQMCNSTLGSFPEGLDNRYFEVLNKLANAVSSKWLHSSLYIFNDFAKPDAEEFLEVLNRSPKLSSKQTI
jgi:hypothetical protein